MTIKAVPTYPSNTGQFRRERVGNPNAGGCTLCRSSKVNANRLAVDLGPNSQPFREGRVVLCNTCAKAVGKAVGMIDQTEAEKLIEHAKTLTDQLDHANAELEAFANLRDSLDRLTAKSHTPA